jgi:competence protein ComEA
MSTFLTHALTRPGLRALSGLALAGALGLAFSPAHALDVNTATAQQLEALRGIGPHTAQIILQERQRGGRFESLEDLSERVRGIGPKRVKTLQEAGLTAGPGGAGPIAGPQAGPAAKADSAGKAGKSGSTAKADSTAKANAPIKADAPAQADKPRASGALSSSLWNRSPTPPSRKP